MKELTDPDHVNARAYLANDRKVNAHFAMGSITTHRDTTLPRGPNVVKLNNDMQPRLSDLRRSSKHEQPTFGQYYALKADEAINYRLKTDLGKGPLGVGGVHSSVISEIDRMLRKKHALASSYSFAAEKFEEACRQAELNNEPIPTIRMTLLNNREAKLAGVQDPNIHTHRTEIPVTEQVAVIWISNDDNAKPPDFQGIDLHNTPDGTVNMGTRGSVPLVLPTCFPILDPFGLQGYRFGLPNKIKEDADRAAAEAASAMEVDGEIFYDASDVGTQKSQSSQKKADSKHPDGEAEDDEQPFEEANKKDADAHGVITYDGVNHDMQFNVVDDPEDQQKKKGDLYADPILFSQGQVADADEKEDEFLGPVMKFKEGEEEKAGKKAAKGPKKTKLTAYFDLCKVDPAARELRFDEIPKHYVFQERQKRWKKRKNDLGEIVTRVGTISPANRELFAIRLLLLHCKGVTSWEDLRTVTDIDGNKRIRDTDLIIIDEVSMMHRVVLEYIEKVLKSCYTDEEIKKKPFCGKIVVLSGDFKQLGPIPFPEDQHGAGDEQRKAAVLTSSLKCSKIFEQFKELKLTENMRMDPAEVEFRNLVRNIGLGRNFIPGTEFVQLPADRAAANAEEVVSFCYPDDFLKDPLNNVDLAKGSNVLLPRNNAVFKWNDVILNRMRGRAKTFLGIDRNMERREDQGAAMLKTHQADHDLENIHMDGITVQSVSHRQALYVENDDLKKILSPEYISTDARLHLFPEYEGVQKAILEVLFGKAHFAKRAITKTGGGSPKSDRPTRSEAEITMDTAYEQSLVVHGIEGGVETGEENDEGFESDEGNEERTPDRITSSLSKARHALKEHKAADADKNDVTTLRIQLLKHEIHRSELHCELLREKLHLAQEKRQLLRQEQQHRDEIHAAQLASMGFSDVSDIVVD
ncbi:hypothetical protein QR680_014588 [Steinernema hermaphroditum]|uniref:ATP-dependent DNA helicase n=1 Tax=Steinernema hermaphroditum TaxID=289476 RepID=A0AA39M4B7_9BILA|nr:hypothetical protein QR680_014588 [Steinernema hermaphroditum]